MKVKILGSGQDAGVPQTGCSCDSCTRARKNPEYRRLGPSIAFMDTQKKYCFLVDASPDIKPQIDMIAEEDVGDKRKGPLPVSGIFLTHAHFGHCAGLLEMGTEAVNEDGMPVYCTQKMADFLRDNNPFRLLVEKGNIQIIEILPGQELPFEDFACIPFPVPHRNEVSDCVGYCILAKESGRSLVYVPDADHWDDDVLERIRGADFAVLDGTFYSRHEISRYQDVPHPPVKETVNILGDEKEGIYFTHINHTNPLNFMREERKSVESQGFKCAFDGMAFEL